MKPFPTNYQDFTAPDASGNWETLQDVLAQMISDGQADDIDFCEIGNLAIRKEANLITEYHYAKEFFLATVDAANEWLESHPSYGSEAA